MFNRNSLVIEENEVNIDDNFSSLDGFRIMHISDLHLAGRNRQFDGFFAKLSKIECDLAIVSGDLIHADTGITACVEYLSNLNPRYKTFVILGNHDRYYGGIREFIFFKLIKRLKSNNSDLLRSKLKENGISVLENETEYLDVGATRIRLIGLDSPLGYDIFGAGMFKEELKHLRQLASKVSRDDYNILIFHIPDLVQEFDTQSINLMLASHTHGGQIRLPIIGPLIVQSPFQKKYNRGIFKYNRSYLHVSSGLGVNYCAPFRFNCPPSATVIMLKANKRKAYR